MWDRERQSAQPTVGARRCVPGGTADHGGGRSGKSEARWPRPRLKEPGPRRQFWIVMFKSNRSVWASWTGRQTSLPSDMTRCPPSHSQLGQSKPNLFCSSFPSKVFRSMFPLNFFRSTVSSSNLFRLILLHTVSSSFNSNVRSCIDAFINETTATDRHPKKQQIGKLKYQSGTSFNSNVRSYIDDFFNGTTATDRSSQRNNKSEN